MELGAGVGLLGLNCLKLAKIKQYIFTDSHSLVIKQIQKNVSYNYPLEDEAKNIQVIQLDWVDFKDSPLFMEEQELKIDLILASGWYLSHLIF